MRNILPKLPDKPEFLINRESAKRGQSFENYGSKMGV